MLHTKLCGNRPASSGEKDFFRILAMYGPGGHLDHVTRIISKIFISIYLKAYIQNLVKNGPVVSEKSMF